MAPKENSLKKIYRSEFLQSSLIFVIYLLKEVYRKIMSEIHFVGKTRYEDLTETGSTGQFREFPPPPRGGVCYHFRIHVWQTCKSHDFVMSLTISLVTVT